MFSLDLLQNTTTKMINLYKNISSHDDKNPQHRINQQELLT